MQNIVVEIVNDRVTWNAFVAGNTTETFHQSWEWGEVYRKDNHLVWYVGAYLHNELIAVCLTVKIKAKRGEEIIKEIIPNDFFSYTAFFDIANPDGDYNTFPFYEVLRKIKLSKKSPFRHFKSIKKPSLVIYGDKDEYAWGNVPKIVEILKKYQPSFDYRIIKGADHGFNGHEAALARVVAKWL